MKEKNQQYQQGFTLVELLAGMSLFTILIIVVIGIQTILSRGSNFSLSTALTIENANSALNNTISELKKATYADNGAFPIQQALDQTITFYANLDDDPDIEKVRYFLDGTDFKKGVIQPTGFPITYPAENESVKTVANYIRNGSDPIFFYYNDSWPQDKINNPLTTPPDLNQLTFVRVSVKVNSSPGQPDSEMLLESSAQIRKLKDNLNL